MEEKVWNALKNVNSQLTTYNGESYFDAGLLDSLQVVNLIESLENEFDIEIDAKYIREDNFKSQGAILEMMREILNE